MLNLKNIILWLVINCILNQTGTEDYNSVKYFTPFNYLNYYHGKHYLNITDFTEYLDLYGNIKRTGINYDAISTDNKELLLYFTLSTNEFDKVSETYYNNLNEIDIIGFFYDTFESFKIKGTFNYITDININYEDDIKITYSLEKDNILNLKFTTVYNANYIFVIYIYSKANEYYLNLKIKFYANEIYDRDIFEFKDLKFKFELITRNFENFKNNIFPKQYIIINENEILNNLIYKDMQIATKNTSEFLKIYNYDYQKYLYNPYIWLVDINISDFYMFDHYLINKNIEFYNIIENKKFGNFYNGDNKILAVINQEFEVLKFYNLYNKFQEKKILILDIIKKNNNEEKLLIIKQIIKINDKNSDLTIISKYNSNTNKLQNLDSSLIEPVNNYNLLYENTGFNYFIKNIEIDNLKLVRIYISFDNIYYSNLTVLWSVENDSLNFFYFKRIQYFKGYRTQESIDANDNNTLFLYYKKFNIKDLNTDIVKEKGVIGTHGISELNKYVQFRDYSFFTLYHMDMDIESTNTTINNIEISLFAREEVDLKYTINFNNPTNTIKFTNSFMVNKYKKNDNNHINNYYIFKYKEVHVSKVNQIIEGITFKSITFYRYYLYDILNKSLIFSLDCNDFLKYIEFTVGTTAAAVGDNGAGGTTTTSSSNINYRKETEEIIYYLKYSYNSDKNLFKYSCVDKKPENKIFNKKTNIIYNCPKNCKSCQKLNKLINNIDTIVFIKCLECNEGFNNINGYCHLNIDFNTNSTNNNAGYAIDLNKNLNLCSNFYKICKDSKALLCIRKFCKTSEETMENTELLIFSCKNETNIFKNSICQDCSNSGGRICSNMQILECAYNKIKGKYINICTNGSINNCFLFSDYGDCLECRDNHVLKENKCVRCDEKCIDCNNNGCLKCLDGFYLDSKKCYKCVDKNAISCKSKLVSYECKTNFILNSKNECVSCLSEEEDQKMSNCEGKCLNFNYCEKCKKNYFKNEKSICTRCSLKNCKSCKSIDECEECNDKYFLYKGVCIECNFPCLKCISSNKCIDCQPGYLFNTKENFCEKCNYVNCMSCDTNFSFCTKCYNSFYLDSKDKSCKKCNDNCINCSNFENNCISCPEGFLLRKSNYNKDINICVKKCIKNNYFYYLKSNKCIDCEPNFDKQTNHYYSQDVFILILKEEYNFKLEDNVILEHINIKYEGNNEPILFSYEFREKYLIFNPKKKFEKNENIIFTIKNEIFNKYNNCNNTSIFKKIFRIEKSQRIVTNTTSVSIIDLEDLNHLYKNGTFIDRSKYYNNLKPDKKNKYFDLSNENTINVIILIFKILHNILYIISILLIFKIPTFAKTFMASYLLLKLYISFIMFFITVNVNINVIDYILFQIKLFVLYTFEVNQDIIELNNDYIMFKFPKLINENVNISENNICMFNITINNVFIILVILLKLFVNFKTDINYKIKSNKIMPDDSKLNINNLKKTDRFAEFNFIKIIKSKSNFFYSTVLIYLILIELIDKIFILIFYLNPVNFGYFNFEYFINNLISFSYFTILIVLYFYIYFKTPRYHVKFIEMQKMEYNSKNYKYLYINDLFNLDNNNFNQKIIYNLVLKLSFIITLVMFNLYLFEDFLTKSLISFFIGYFYFYSFNFNKNNWSNIKITIIFLILLTRILIELYDFLIYLYVILQVLLFITIYKTPKPQNPKTPNFLI